MNKKDVQSTNTRRATVSHRAYYNNAQHFICQIDRVRGYNDFFFAFCLLLLLHVFNIYHFIIYNCRLCAFFCVEYVCQQTHHPIQAWIVSYLLFVCELHYYRHFKIHFEFLDSMKSFRLFYFLTLSPK